MAYTPIFFQVDPHYNADDQQSFDGASNRQNWEWDEFEKLCFTCHLKECKDTSSKCPMQIAKKAAREDRVTN